MTLREQMTTDIKHNWWDSWSFKGLDLTDEKTTHEQGCERYVVWLNTLPDDDFLREYRDALQCDFERSNAGYFNGPI